MKTTRNLSKAVTNASKWTASNWLLLLWVAAATAALVISLVNTFMYWYWHPDIDVYIDLDNLP